MAGWVPGSILDVGKFFFLFQPHWIYIVTLHKGGPSTVLIPFSMGDTGASFKSFNDARWRLLS